MIYTQWQIELQINCIVLFHTVSLCLQVCLVYFIIHQLSQITRNITSFLPHWGADHQNVSLFSVHGGWTMLTCCRRFLQCHHGNRCKVSRSSRNECPHQDELQWNTISLSFFVSCFLFCFFFTSPFILFLHVISRSPVFQVLIVPECFYLFSVCLFCSSPVSPVFLPVFLPVFPVLLWFVL